MTANPYQAPSLAASDSASFIKGYCHERERATIARFMAINNLIAGSWFGVCGVVGVPLAIAIAEGELPWYAAAALLVGVLIAAALGWLHLKRHALAIYATGVIAAVAGAGSTLFAIQAAMTQIQDNALLAAVLLVFCGTVFVAGLLAVGTAYQAWVWRNRGVSLDKLHLTPLIRSTRESAR